MDRFVGFMISDDMKLLDCLGSVREENFYGSLSEGLCLFVHLCDLELQFVLTL